MAYSKPIPLTRAPRHASTTSMLDEFFLGEEDGVEDLDSCVICLAPATSEPTGCDVKRRITLLLTQCLGIPVKTDARQNPEGGTNPRVQFCDRHLVLLTQFVTHKDRMDGLERQLKKEFFESVEQDLKINPEPFSSFVDNHRGHSRDPIIILTMNEDTNTNSIRKYARQHIARMGKGNQHPAPSSSKREDRDEEEAREAELDVKLEDVIRYGLDTIQVPDFGKAKKAESCEQIHIEFKQNGRTGSSSISEPQIKQEESSTLASTSTGFEEKAFKANARAEPGAIADNYAEFNLKPELLSGLRIAGLIHPTGLQKRAIPPAIQGKNMIVRCASVEEVVGTFSNIAILQRLDPTISQCQALILTATRELAQHITSEIASIGSNLGATVHTCVGGSEGTSVNLERQKLRAGMQVVAGTPGRVYDMISRRALDTKNIQTLVVAEAEVLFCPKFKDHFYTLFQLIKRRGLQIIVICDCYVVPPHVYNNSCKIIMEEPVKISYDNEEVGIVPFSKGTRFLYQKVRDDSHKLDVLLGLYDSLYHLTKAIIYCNTKRKVKIVTEFMRKEFRTVATVHGDLPRNEKEIVMDEFRSRENLRWIVSTDLLSLYRNTEIPNLSLVINFDMPNLVESFRRRVNRGPSFKSSGVVYNLISEGERATLMEYLGSLKLKLAEMPKNIATCF